MDYLSHLKVLFQVEVTDEDQFRVKGIETSMGYIGWLGHIETEDSVFTGILRKLGAVFYGNFDVISTNS